MEISYTRFRYKKKNDNFEIYINIISNGFTKTVSVMFNSIMYPLQSSAKIIVDGQIVMDTKCSFTGNSLTISTLMSPYNKTMSQNFEINQRIIGEIE